MKGDLRILVFKGDPHTVDGERVLLVLVPVVMPGDVALHCGDVRDVLHTRKEPGGHKGELSCGFTTFKANASIDVSENYVLKY